MLNSKAITKIQAVILAAIIVVSVVAGFAYFLLSEPTEPSETVKIGFVRDFNLPDTADFVRVLELAAEQVNAEGGVLGRNFEIVTEHAESLTGTFDDSINALQRLISVDEADFILSFSGPGLAEMEQEVAFQHKRILIHGGDPRDEMTQRVLDDYDRYKYYFKMGTLLNRTTNRNRIISTIVACRELTGFNKVAVLVQDLGIGEAIFAPDVAGLQQFGFDVVNTGLIPLTAVDYTSYFVRAEAAGAEILYTILFTNGVPFVKEYHNRQSPTLIWGPSSAIPPTSDAWETSDGKCEYIIQNVGPVAAWYPATNKTLETCEALAEVSEQMLSRGVVGPYDFVRFILPDAIRRAGTIETEAVIKALEETDIETSQARHFMFTSSHDIMVIDAYLDNPNEAYWMDVYCQWQDGSQVLVYPLEVMEALGTTYKFPNWPGPWD